MSRYVTRYDEKLMKHYFYDTVNKEMLKFQDVEDYLNKQDETIAEINKEFLQAIQDWKKLIAEKDKEIERLKKILHLLLNDEHIRIWTDVYDTKGNIIGERAFNEEDKARIYSLNNFNQCQNQKSIEELERLKDFFVQENEDGDTTVTEDIFDVAEFINKRIKVLKGE